MDIGISEKLSESRRIWATTRAQLEADKFKHKKKGKRSKSYWSIFEQLIIIFGIFLKLLGLYQKGVNNAKTIEINNHQLSFPHLPDSFIGYKILHLSDLHIDCIRDFEDVLIDKIKDLDYDLCLMTGDYRKNTSGSLKTTINPLKKLVSHINAKDGIYAILGNHDTYYITEFESEIGLNFLINESIIIEKETDHITITGTDDPFYYYTDAALHALEQNFEGLKIAMVHTTELMETAADNHYDLYLCGHTHGGQICLPGGIPIITHQFEGKRYYKGFWKHKEMIGYTSTGCGVSAIPIRFNSPAEISLFTLNKA